MRKHIIFQGTAETDRRQGMSRVCLANGLQSMLQNVPGRNKLFVHYQPRITKNDGRIKDMEALVRWYHPKRGLIEPDRFIPVAEETGMISELGKWVLFTTLATQKRWLETDVNPGTMAVNVSPRQLADNGFSRKVESLLDTVQVKPDQLELEITESRRMDDMDQAVDSMNY